MIRSDEQVRLDDCVVAAGRARLGLEDAAALVRDHDSALAELFDRLAQAHAQHVEGLAAHLKALGDLPSEPDPDRSAAKKLFRHVKAALAREDRLALIRDREQDEDELARALTRALDTHLPEAARATVTAYRKSVENGERALAEARVRVNEQATPAVGAMTR